MKKTIPIPIMNSMIKVGLCCTAMSVCGVVCSVATGDSTLLLLSATVFGIGVAKVWEIYRQVRDNDYVIVEGKLIVAHDMGFQKRIKAYFEIPSQGQMLLRLHGRIRLKQGTRYRLYLTKPIEGAERWTVPEYMRPAQNVLGYEVLEDADEDTGVSEI